MTDTPRHMSVSLDGFAAGPDEVAAGWLLRPRGAYVMGRNMFGPLHSPLTTPIRYRRVDAV